MRFADVAPFYGALVVGFFIGVGIEYGAIKTIKGGVKRYAKNVLHAIAHRRPGNPISNARAARSNRNGV